MAMFLLVKNLLYNMSRPRLDKLLQQNAELSRFNNALQEANNALQEAIHASEMKLKMAFYFIMWDTLSTPMDEKDVKKN